MFEDAARNKAILERIPAGRDGENRRIYKK